MVAALENVQPANGAEITEENPLRVLIAGAGVGGLVLANGLVKNPKMNVTVLERTEEFRRFGGPIQLASNALQILKEQDSDVFAQIMEKFTFTGDKKNGIKDGIRDEWYAMFDLQAPAEARDMPLTGVIERPDLQEIYLKALPKGVVHNGDGVKTYETHPGGNGVRVILDSGEVVDGDVIIGADGIWSNVRATMRNEPAKGAEGGASYSGYTVFAGELNYDSFDNGEVGYKVYIGPEKYFVITDIGKGRYQWYAFLARLPGSAETEEKPDGSVPFLKNIFEGWSPAIHHILDATKEDEIGQRDLYDRPPSVRKPWTAGPVALLGDSIHAMMPNLGQGGCQAIEDAYVITQELASARTRGEIDEKFQSYRNRRVVRSSVVQGLSRIASDLIIQVFYTPAKIYLEDGLKVENFQYTSIVTRMLQPILPIFFSVQFNFLYAGWKNEAQIDVKAALGFLFIGSAILLAGVGVSGEAGLGIGLGLEALFDAEAVETFTASIQSVFDALGGGM
jgi:zeaxanthin epoxidase